MKKTVFILMVLMSAIVFAHSPSSVNLKYNKSDNILKIEAEHSVRNVNNHYIDEITIHVNDKEKDVITFEKQSESKKETYNYNIGKLKEGDKIKVDVSCSRFGSRTSEIIVK